jgi:hypothetical protein
MAKRSPHVPRNTHKKKVVGCGYEAEPEHILVETPQETLNAVARIKAHFIDIEKEICQEKKQKNPNAVALGRLGGLKSGNARRAHSAVAAKNQERQ